MLAGGVAAAVLGFLGLIFWWKQFLVLLAGGIPIALLLGGGLAIYVGIDEFKDKQQEDIVEADKDKELEETKKELEQTKAKAERLSKAQEDLEKAKAEAEKYKEELEKVKTNIKKKAEK
ncbi:MAG: hypothetical protein Q7J27_02165 [Syntrophales bacterium]|nr:hypothetical protein [Syntrophales bacterium]